ncbi:hypothetical protein GN316_06905 [Xylophilus sp. Kf1]|nr:hypothetical protein [Xylophilus sp. Kf1]
MDLFLQNRTGPMPGAGDGVGGDGITAATVLPGSSPTGRTRTLDEDKARCEGQPVENVSRESTAAMPMGRHGSIDGSTLRIDGGRVAGI